MKKIKQYDIWLANLDPRRGTEPWKVRPVIIVQTNLLNGIHPSTLVCPITSNIIHGANLLRVHIDQTTDEMKLPCDIMIDQVRAIDNNRLIRKIGNILPEQARKVRENLVIVMDL